MDKQENTPKNAPDSGPDKRSQRDQGSDGAWWQGGLRQALGLPASVQIAGGVVKPITDIGAGDMANALNPLPPSLGRASPKRQSEYLAGRACVVAALLAGGCAADAAAPPAMGEDRLPQWPPGWLGCITHGHGEAIAAVSHVDATRLLGIDVERLIDPVSVNGIAELVALGGELAQFTDCTPSQALTILFSAKESLYKALYPEVRRFMDFSAARVTAFSAGALELRLVEDWHPAWRAGSRFSLRYALRGERVYTALHLARLIRNSLLAILGERPGKPADKRPKQFTMSD
jgi:enterobactin synthetase component D